MIQEQYVSFETAKLLKEKGFDNECSGHYDQERVLQRLSACSIKDTLRSPFYFDCIPAPTQQMAMRWLREIHHIHIEVSLYSSDEDGKPLFCPCAYNTIRCNQIGLGCYDSFQRLSYEEAVEVTLNWCLENLIK